MYSNFILFTNPVAVVQAVSLIFHFGWINAIALVVLIVGGMLMGAMLVQLYDSQRWKQIIDGYFREFNDQYFKPTTIKEFEELENFEQSFENTWDVMRSKPAIAPFLSRLLKPRIRAFYVYPKGQDSASPAALKTYPMWSGTNYVFLPPEDMALQEQLPEKLWKLRQMVRRFQILHEIGHGNAMHLIIDMWAWGALPNFCLLFIFVIFHHEAGILALLIVLALAAMWVYYFLQQQRNREGRIELVADAFALVYLASRHDFRTTIAHLARAFRKQNKFGRYRAGLLVRRAQILSRTGSEFSSRWRQGGSWLEETLLPIPLWLSLLIFAGMLWLGATLKIKDWKELGALSLFWLVGPALWLCYYFYGRVTLPRTARARRVALKFLQAHAPPDLPEKRQVRTVFDLI